MKTTMIRFFSVLAVALCMTACGNYSGSSDRLATTPGTSITTTAPVVTTTVATVTNEPEEAVTTTTSSSSEETTVTTAITTPKVTTTTKKPTTTTKAPVVTTTKKPTTVTTTKKPTVTTTTTTKKKATTTTTTAKKQEITTTTSRVIKITQDDVDRLVDELQEYSNSKCDFDNLFYTEEEMWERIARKTPSNSSWTAPTTIWKHYDTYEDSYDRIKEYINWIYEVCPDSHIVLYAQWCPNGEGSTNTCDKRDHWQIYCLR